MATIVPPFQGPRPADFFDTETVSRTRSLSGINNLTYGFHDRKVKELW